MALAADAPVLELTCTHFAGGVTFCLEERLINFTAVPEAEFADFSQIGPGTWLLKMVPWSAAEHGISAVSADLTPAAALVEASEKADFVVTSSRGRGRVASGLLGSVSYAVTAFRNLYAFLSQIIPYQDSELEKFYTFVRNLISKLPPPGGGRSYALDDEVALRYYRLQQLTDGSIDLHEGEAYPLKGPTDLGTGAVKDEEVPLSTLVEKLNERFGTDFTRADQLFFDQIRVSAEDNEKIIEAAKANNLTNFAAFLEKALDELFIDRMEGNEDIFSRVMTDRAFRNAAQEHLAREIFERVRKGDERNSES